MYINVENNVKSGTNILLSPALHVRLIFLKDRVYFSIFFDWMSLSVVEIIKGLSVHENIEFCRQLRLGVEYLIAIFN